MDVFSGGLGLRGLRALWVPLALGVLAALDVLESGRAALTAWRPRLDAASQRAFAHAEPKP
jgi:hypothetical protein